MPHASAYVKVSYLKRRVEKPLMSRVCGGAASFGIFGIIMDWIRGFEQTKTIY